MSWIKKIARNLGGTYIRLGFNSSLSSVHSIVLIRSFRSFAHLTFNETSYVSLGTSKRLIRRSDRSQYVVKNKISPKTFK